MNYTITLSNFEGPLDLLLHLVKETKMDIYEVNISLIIERYLEYINSLKDLNIDIASEYLVMAADLIHIKSKKLINKDFESENKEEETFIESEEDLKKKLKMYEQYKKIGESLSKLEENRKDYYTKLPENLSEYREEDTKLSTDISIEDLINAFLRFKDREKYIKPINTRVTKKELSVHERIVSIRNVIKEKKKLNFVELFDSFKKDYVIVTFLSILEMAKNNEISLTQSDNFQDIMIEGRWLWIY